MKAPAVVIAPDSFKGCLDAAAVAAAIAEGVLRACPSAQITRLPLADGGEGSMDCLAAARPEARWQSARVEAVHRQDIDARWLQLDADTALIESAEVLGLPLVSAGGPDIYQRGSTSLGDLLLAAMDAGCRKIFLALGGSATNDCGIGMLQQLGGRFLNGEDAMVSPDLAGLMQTRRVLLEGLDARLAQADLVVLCDVNNPLCGPTGAAQVYGLQKGLSAEDVDRVDEGFAAYAALCLEQSSADVKAPGAGAAGGLGFALSLLGAELASGAETILELCELSEKAGGARLLVTGEGRADGQTLHGKLPAAVAAAGAVLGVPSALVAGDVAVEARAALGDCFAAVESLTQAAGSPERAIAEAPHWLAEAGERLARRLLAG